MSLTIRRSGRRPGDSSSGETFLGVQLSASEKQLVRDAALAAGVSISELVRPAILGVASAVLTLKPRQVRITNAIVQQAFESLETK